MELIKIKGNSYEEYEALIMEREKLKKDAEQYNMNYVYVFGDLIIESYNQKIKCIRKKLAISFCQTAVNFGRIIDLVELNDYLDGQTEEYQKKLDEMIADNEICKNLKEISEADLQKIKQIYRKIAKMLHPDLNPAVAGNEKLMELWNMAASAYHCNDLQNLEELEIIIMCALNEENLCDADIVIPDLTEKIEALRKEIEEIRTTDPYMYKFLLADPVAVRKKKKELEAEIEEFKEYEKYLNSILREFIKEGVTFPWEDLQ